MHCCEIDCCDANCLLDEKNVGVKNWKTTTCVLALLFLVIEMCEKSEMARQIFNWVADNAVKEQRTGHGARGGRHVAGCWHRCEKMDRTRLVAAVVLCRKKHRKDVSVVVAVSHEWVSEIRAQTRWLEHAVFGAQKEQITVGRRVGLWIPLNDIGG